MTEKVFRTSQKDYIEKYGDYSDTRDELIEYINSNYKIKQDRLDSLTNHIANLQWEEISIILFIIPKSTPRARWSPVNQKFYVKNAAYNKKSIKGLLEECNIIYTNTHIDIKTFQPTPKAMKPEEILLAEKGLIEPIVNPDFDNLAKTYTDMLQDNLLLNDNLITKGNVEKYYSLKPRVEIKIKYSTTFDCNFSRVRSLKSKRFIDMIDPVLYEAIQSDII